MTRRPPGVDRDLVNRYGDVKLAYMLISNIEVVGTPPRLKKIARRVEADVRADATKDRFAPWLELAKQMGLAEEELPAPNALLDQVLAGRNIPKINCVVDAANITALTYMTPVGVFDLKKLAPPIRLREAAAHEAMVPILSDHSVNCRPGEIVYADAEGVFSRYSRDADRTKVTEETTDLLCVVDGTPQHGVEILLEALEHLRQLLTDVIPTLEVEDSGLAAVR